MKTSYITLSLALGILSLRADPLAATGQTTVPAPTAYAITQQDGNSSIWERTEYEQSPTGQAVPKTHKYTELATGLNHLVNGQWVASTEEISLLSDGTAAATNGQHQAYFPPDIYNGQIELVTPDGRQLKSQPVGLCYDDGSNTVFIAVLTNSVGQLLGANQVIYTNAFAGVEADLVYTYTKAGFEQDIVLRAQPPAPGTFNLNPDNTRLQVLTEFFDPPQPGVTTSLLSSQAGMSLNDDTLQFGTMQMVPGKAFVLGENSPSVQVAKSWVALQGRQFLVEQVPVAALADELERLPAATAQTRSNTGLPPIARHLMLPVQHLAKTVPITKPMRLALANTASSGLVLDYNTVNSSLTNSTFQGDTTYYISGTVYLYGTNNIFEGGTVVKYAANASINMMAYSTLNWQTAAYRPAIFTAKDDNSVGDTISGSTGSPSGYYANPALSFLDNTNTASNFRILWANQAISALYASQVISQGQLINCLKGVYYGYGTLTLENLLFSNVRTNFNYINSGSVNVQNTTFSGSSLLLGWGYLTLTNCILANVAALTNINYSVFFSGDHNGFYNSQAFGTNQKTNIFYPFQSVGAGNYYLTNGCSFFNAGTTNIDSTLLADLQQKTTHPPILLSNVTVFANTVLSPQAQRDNAGNPDLGYHYDPIDYMVDMFAVTNALLTINSGTVVASDNSAAGIWLQDGSSITSIGTPLMPNYFIHYTCVQEQPVSIGTNESSGFYGGMFINSYHFSNPVQNGIFQFSKFLIPAGAYGYYFYDTTSWAYQNLLVQNCELWNNQNEFDGLTAGVSTVATIENSLFDGSSISTINNGSYTLSFTNNLFFNTSVGIATGTNSLWSFFNNDFDTCTIPSGRLVRVVANGYNAYLNCSGRLNPTNAYDLVSTNTLGYLEGPLGTFYQPTNSPLINAGSTNANLVGLYHFTTQTNQTIEADSMVDIGYHYIATGANGIPLDSNGDGIPDYLEDANGNGTVNAGETNWALAILVQPTNQTVLECSNATFSVTAGGIASINYQWYFGSASLSGATNVSLTLTDVQPTSAGNYYVVVTNSFGSITSSVAALTVVPMIVTVPTTNQLVYFGSPMTFGVSVSVSACCNGPFTNQWLHDGTNISVNDGIITTVAGIGGIPGYYGDGGLATNAELDFPNGMAVDAFNNFYIVDTYDDRIRKVDTNGIITTVAGNGSYDYSGDGGAATNASLRYPSGVAFDALGNFYIVDAYNNLIRKVDTNGIITTVAGNGSYGYSGDGGSATNAQLDIPNGEYDFPSGVTVDAFGNLYIADTENYCIRKVDTNGIITTVAGNGSSGYSGDGGSATNAQLNYPSGVAVDALGNFYIVDAYNNLIRKVDTNGIITTVVGNGSSGYSGDGGAATNAQLGFPNGVAVDAFGNFYIADTGNNAIRKVDINGIITTVAGNGSYGYSGDGGAATNAELYEPYGVALDASDHYIYIADTWNNVVRKVTNKIVFNPPNFTLFDMTTNDAGNYQLIVSGPCGSVTSSVVSVLILPVITTQPANQMALQGGSATFNVAAIGQAPLNYQWRFNGADIVGATNASLTLTNVQPSSAGLYSVVVSNVAGSAISTNAALTVGIPNPFPGLGFNVLITRPQNGETLP